MKNKKYTVRKTVTSFVEYLVEAEDRFDAYIKFNDTFDPDNKFPILGVGSYSKTTNDDVSRHFERGEEISSE